MEPRLWPLIGRDAECAAIAHTLDAEPPHNIVLAGPAGAGRTRLLREALSLAEFRGRPTRSAAASSAAAAVPLGALAPLLPVREAPSADPLALLQTAPPTLAGDRTGPRPVLGVDDAHLLDPLSVTLLHQLAATGNVTLVLTVRTHPAVSDPSAHLWKDELATRLDIRPLRRHDIERLVGVVLDGDVDSRTSDRLWRLSQGSPQFLRELLEDGLETGQLQRCRGLWRWQGPVVPSQRLTEIVHAHLGELDSSEWQAIEVLAAAESLGVHEVAELSSPGAVASLQRRCLMSDAAARRHGEVQIAHPMVREVVRSRVPEAVLRAIREQLAARAGIGQPDECVRRSELLLDRDLSVLDAGTLATAAQRAAASLDHPLAERLAPAGIEAGGGGPAYPPPLQTARGGGVEPRHPSRSSKRPGGRDSRSAARGWPAKPLRWPTRTRTAPGWSRSRCSPSSVGWGGGGGGARGGGGGPARGGGRRRTRRCGRRSRRSGRRPAARSWRPPRRSSAS